MSLCAPDGTCTDDTQSAVSIRFGEPMEVWANATATGPSAPAVVLEPLPTQPGQPLDLLVRPPNADALLIRLRAAAQSTGLVRASLRRVPEGRDPRASDAFTSEAVCTHRFLRP